MDWTRKHDLTLESQPPRSMEQRHQLCPLCSRPGKEEKKEIVTRTGSITAHVPHHKHAADRCTFNTSQPERCGLTPSLISGKKIGNMKGNALSGTHSPDTRPSSSWSNQAVLIRPPPQVPEGQQPILQQGQHHSWLCYIQEHSKRTPWWKNWRRKQGSEATNTTAAAADEGKCLASRTDLIGMSVIVARHAEREDCAWFMKGDNWQAQAGRPWDTPLTLVGHRQGQALG